MESVGGEAEVLACGGDVLMAKECPELGDGGASIDLCDSVGAAKQVCFLSWGRGYTGMPIDAQLVRVRHGRESGSC